MKKYIAIALNNGNTNSGLKTLEEAKAWAAKTLADRPQLEEVLLVEVQSKVRRITPTIEITGFDVDAEVENEGSSKIKKAA